ncbi:hypothetical protein FS749_003196 [Ceratobasidium sp. UAMH 11750]|nr:hypothetical protein FS749_003196 [Ceratobasidium sp. UAMH 11750]
MLSASLGQSFRRAGVAALATVAQHDTLPLTLSNGFTIATESHPHAQTATVGVWIDAGSHAEMDETNDTAHFLKHMR